MTQQEIQDLLARINRGNYLVKDMVEDMRKLLILMAATKELK